MNDMNELTNKLQQVMVPKAALIAYEYRENRYGNGMHYLELHPINDRGRMEAAMPVTYEFMDSLVESYTDDRRNVPHGKIPANMLWCDTRKGHERYIWYNPPGKRQMFFAGSLNIPDGIFHVPGVSTRFPVTGWTFSPIRGKNRWKTARFSSPLSSMSRAAVSVWEMPR